jgi:hypothetical protein
MKKPALVSLVVAFVLVTMTIEVFAVRRIMRSRTIIAALNQNAQNARDCTETITFGGRERKRFLARKFVDKLHEVDTSDCPMKFQLAWLDYVHCWERQGEQTPAVVLGELYLGMFGVATRSSSLSKLATKPIETKDALETSWQNLETVALEYDVRVTHKTE